MGPTDSPTSNPTTTAPTTAPTDLPTSSPTTTAPTTSSGPTPLFVTDSPTLGPASVMKVDRIRTTKRNKRRGKFEIIMKLWIADGNDDRLVDVTVVMSWQTNAGMETIEEITSSN